MKQILQDLKSGTTGVFDVPAPGLKAGHVLIGTRASLISAGTERMLVEFGRGNLLEKARQQPHRVAEVIQKARRDGVGATLETVRSRLENLQPLGYSNVGVVLGVGEGVTDLSVGDRVVSNGRHAEVVLVPRNLCARVPDAVPDADAAFTVVGSIALQGVRLLQPTLGERFVVYGLGLLGLIAAQILQAHGCDVLGVDLDADRVDFARKLGIDAVAVGAGTDPVAAAMAFSDGIGVDGVLLTVATSAPEPMQLAPRMCRKRGRIVLVGVSGLELRRADFYEKELSFQVSCSYGPGRYDPSYEDEGQDYPVGFVRWTERRNFQAVLRLLEQGRLRVAPLIGATADVDDAARLYDDLVAGGFITALVRYPEREGTSMPRVEVQTPASRGEGRRQGTPQQEVRVAVIGAGNFARARMMPALRRHGAVLDTVVSTQGLSGAMAARKFGFRLNTTTVEDAFDNDAIRAVLIATRHDSHADLVVRALEAGKDVFVEKPLAITREQLDRIVEAVERAGGPESAPRVMVGYNRRFAPATRRLMQLIAGRTAPVSMIATMNAGALPANHWTQNLQTGGGRIIGEGCHYVDLLQHIAGARIVSVTASAFGATPAERLASDTMSITLDFADGSHGSIHYFANGHRAFPKERIEVFSEERILRIDNFRRLEAWGAPTERALPLLAKQDKGHDAAVGAFLDAIRSGAPSPIPFADLVNSAEATIAAVHAAADRERIEL